MRPLVTFLGIALSLGAVYAQVTPAPVTVEIQRFFHGSGQPDQSGYENATMVTNDVYHAPQFMPGSPTAASIWARVVEVPCKLEGGVVRCKGYHWHPDLGRGEYLYFKPVIVASVGAGPQEPANSVGSIANDPLVLALSTSLSGAAAARSLPAIQTERTRPMHPPSALDL